MTRDELFELYINKQMTLAEIAAATGLSHSQMKYLSKKYELPTRASNRRRKQINVGEEYGYLTVIESDGRTDNSVPLYKCQCRCGTVCHKTASDLTTPRSKNKMCWDCRNKFISAIKWKGYGDISGDFWSSIVNGAAARDIPFEITIDQAWDIFQKQNKKCSLTGDDLFFVRDGRKDRGNASLDRIDSSKGYTVDNVQWVHKNVNISKNDMPLSVFIEMCVKIASRYET